MTRAPGGVLHVVPSDVLRGAQVYARALRDALDDPATSAHVVVSLFEGETAAPPSDITLGVPSGPLRRLGLDPRAALGLRREMRDLGVDVVVAHGGEPLRYVAAVAPRRCRIVYLRIGVHGTLPFGQRAALRRVQHALAVSSAAADDLRALTGRTVEVIPNGRDPRPFAQPATRGAEPPQLLFVGHLDPDKQPLRFVELVAGLRARGIEVRAAIVGDGPLAGAVRAAADGIEVLGHRTDVPALMLGADVLVMTSRPPEGMPGVLIEAALAGLPIVTTDVPGGRDVVEDGVSGFVVPVDDADALRERVASLLTDRARREAMGAAARARAAAFTLDATVDRWRSILGR